MNNKKILFLDIDGTIYDNKNRRIPTSTIEALKKLHNNDNIDVAICTGRASYMLDQLDEIREYIDLYILINGQHIIYKNEVIYINMLETEDVVKIIDVLKKYQVNYGFLGQYDEAISYMDNIAENAFDIVNLKLPKVNPMYYKKNDVLQMWMFCDDSTINAIDKEIDGFNMVSWQMGGCDIIKEGVSKAKGIEYVLNHLGYKHENVYAFGDANNDYEMIQYAHVGVCMGNGTEKAKSVADFVTDDIDKDGLAKAFKKFNLI